MKKMMIAIVALALTAGACAPSVNMNRPSRHERHRYDRDRRDRDRHDDYDRYPDRRY